MSEKESTKRIAELPGLGEKSAQVLKQVGIDTARDLAERGPLAAYIELRNSHKTVSLNLLYAMVGALEGRHWLDIAQTERETLLMQLDGFQEFKRMMEDQV